MVKKKAASPAALPEDKDRGPSFSPDAIVCVSATLYVLRQAIQETAIKRAEGQNPVPLSAMKVALLEYDLGWALQNPEDDKEDSG